MTNYGLIIEVLCTPRDHKRFFQCRIETILVAAQFGKRLQAISEFAKCFTDFSGLGEPWQLCVRFDSGIQTFSGQAHLPDDFSLRYV
jgi:hypothetical protein